MAGPLVPYLRITVPTIPWEMDVVFESAGCARFARGLRPLFEHPLLLRRFLRCTTAMARKMITGDGLSARAKANGYQGGAHRDKDSLRDQDSMWKGSRWIKIQRWIVMSCEGVLSSL